MKFCLTTESILVGADEAWAKIKTHFLISQLWVCFLIMGSNNYYDLLYGMEICDSFSVIC